ncbi:diguanylate cyclase/phosphodiesterase with PAS/PAC sensor(s) [[Leptolyngbya] sp. PCC 7376]|uniref:bifunctional diguanylate cyclase/phosphodiesterase n=1 Tax=[Leptolyngbya] sp. PCC 7376 TaxID=111781 RepID=UPI00029F01BA|nr:bifunctional diguanylate cyclase/phosphodiesterase [[Leptolyngbya] sp. PCC 7376]AFY40482.1 diguanylate cyclase/phosphodiesterase with PAS/PAC sensor(s) [[Leptolyngbya] sp. PCC 7376]
MKNFTTQITEEKNISRYLSRQLWQKKSDTFANSQNKIIIKAISNLLSQEIEFRNQIINALPDLVWLKDSNGFYLACNKRFEDFFGTTKQEIIGKTDRDFMESELANFFSKQAQKAIKKGSSVTNEEWITFAKDEHRKLLKTTKLPIYNQNKKLIGVLGIGHNITKSRKSEESLGHREERFSLAMRGANDGLWDWNLETNETYYSPRWKSMLGYEEEELENQFSTWEKLVHPDDKNIVLDRVQDYLAGAIDAFEVEMRMIHKDGHNVFVLSRAFLVHRESDDKATRLVGTHVDITDRKKAEAFDNRNAEILEMIATGKPASAIYAEIALLYEERHPGLRCSMLELENGRLLHGGAPSLPQAYCDAVHGLKNGPNVGSCGTSTYTGKRVLVENIETDPKWAKIKHVALPHGMRCCWSEPIKSSSGKVLGAFGMYYDYPALPNEEESNDLTSAARLAGIVMERDHAQKRIRELAYTDELTKLASRAHFYEDLEELIEISDRHKRRFGLLYIDLDNFKGVNDSLGHDAGDVLLQKIAKRLEKISRTGDFVARLSGDEFCILVKDIDDDYATAHVAQRCLERISKPVELSGRKFTPACSIGIAHYPDDGQDLSTLLKAADTSLYAAKERGKNQYAFYEQKFTDQAEYRFRVEQNLREAVETQQLSLVYQPKIEMSTGKIIGVEALSRWYHPKLGQVPPNEFIDTAERIGMIKPLTEWVLKIACNQAVAWKRQGLPSLRMAVNISPSHFLDNDFMPLISRVIAETGINPENLELEVTESVVQTDPQNLEIFQQLKELGISLAIDDFGIGYSSFASLKHLAVDYLKIDKYFVNDMLTDQKSKLLVGSMVEMGHILGHEIVAEGIETVEQYQILKSFGCEVAQGYLFSRAVNAETITNLLNKNVIHPE